MSRGTWGRTKKAFRLSPRRFGRPPFGYRSVETPVAHPLFSIGYDAASFMLFGGPTAHGHSGQAFLEKREK